MPDPDEYADALFKLVLSEALIRPAALVVALAYVVLLSCWVTVNVVPFALVNVQVVPERETPEIALL